MTEQATDPLALAARWFAEAEAAGVDQPDAMTLATATPDGRPSARVVLLKGIDERGLTFFTNYESRKAGELDANPRAAVVLHWARLQRQVRAVGDVTRLTAAESDAYFATRPRGSQIGAWASPQSRPLRDRAELERRVAEMTAKYDGRDVPRPPHWGGFRVVPYEIELWEGRPHRLHDRIVYRRTDGGGWAHERLAP